MLDTPGFTASNTNNSLAIDVVNDMTIDEYIAHLDAESIWADSKEKHLKRHYRDMIEQHVKHVLQHGTIDLKGHRYGRFAREINKFVNETDPKRKEIVLGSAAFNVSYDLTCHDDVMFDESVIRGIVSGRTALHGRSTCLTECAACGERLALTLCGNAITVAGEQCVPVGYYETEVTFPSGKVIIGDCINDVHDLIRENYAKNTDNFDMESDASMRDISACYARGGMYHVFVGNSCPGIHNDRARNVITIGNHGYDDDDEPCDEIAGEQLDSICTDLWWASMIDVRTFKKLLKAKHGARKGARLCKEALTGNWSYDVIEIPAGTYIGKSFHHVDGYPDGNKQHVMATLTKVK